MRIRRHENTVPAHRRRAHATLGPLARVHFSGFKDGHDAKEAAG